jgi:hypothetical protein
MVAEVENQINSSFKKQEELNFLLLLNVSGLLKRMFPVKEKRKNIREKLKQTDPGNVVAKAVANAVRASKAAAVNSSQF